MKITLYSTYFMPTVTRRLGRKIRLPAARNFDEKKIVEILKSMHLAYDSRPGKYPRLPHQEATIYEIESEMHKTTLIKQIERRLE